MSFASPPNSTSSFMADSNGYFEFEWSEWDATYVSIASFSEGYSRLIISNIILSDTVYLGTLYLVSVPVKVDRNPRNILTREERKIQRQGQRRYIFDKMKFKFEDIKVPEGYIMKATRKVKEVGIWVYEIDFCDIKTNR